MSEFRAMIVRAGGDPSRLIVVSRAAGRIVSAGAPGSRGRGIASVALDGNSHLIITYTDSATEDAGAIDVSGLLAPLIARIEALEAGSGPVVPVTILVDLDGNTLVDGTGATLIAGD